MRNQIVFNLWLKKEKKKNLIKTCFNFKNQPNIKLIGCFAAETQINETSFQMNPTLKTIFIFICKFNFPICDLF